MRPVVDHLGRFLGNYFHQDWDVESEDDKSVVALFVSENPMAEAERAYAELCALIDYAQKTEACMSDYLRDVECEYDYGAQAMTSIQWLERLRGVFKEVLYPL